jgi:uncharacterized protein YkwD
VLPCARPRPSQPEPDSLSGVTFRVTAEHGCVTEEDVLRKLGAILLAFPVLVRIYLPLILPRSAASRMGVGIVAAALVAATAMASLPPAPSSAVRQAAPEPVAASLLDAVATGHGLTRPFRVTFDAPMDPASVAAALRIRPEAAVSFAWSPDGRTLSVAPVAHWDADTLYTITVSTAARAADGGALAAPLRAVVLTSKSGKAELAATKVAGKRVKTGTAIRITLDKAVSLAAVRAALRVTPPVQGSLADGSSPGTFVFTPEEPLEPDTTYSVSLDGLEDADGVAFTSPGELVIRTADAPSVVRFRPRAGEEAIERTSVLSVRFDEAMNRKATAAAFQVTADGKPVKGTILWAEGGEVLVFRPAAALPYTAKVVMSVGAGATSKAGVAVDKADAGSFTVEKKPKPKARPAPAQPPKKSKSIPRSGGGGAVSGSWTGVESYYLRLMNCTRTGGWVTSGGSCKSPGGRDVAPLALSSGISSSVSRPYAKLLATRNICSHFVGGNPGNRLDRAGYDSYRWAENLGCRSGNPYSAVLGSHLYFQSEKSYLGGHYVNLMNPKYDRVGIGVWVSGGRVRLVVDFYHP